MNPARGETHERFAFAEAERSRVPLRARRQAGGGSTARSACTSAS